MLRPLYAALGVALIMTSSAMAEPARGKGRPTAMTSQSECAKSPVHRSICMIEAVLRDIKATYSQTGGGGISEVRMTATDTYVASILQEERIDQITYKLALDAKGEVVIKQRTEGTKSARP